MSINFAVNKMPDLIKSNFFLPTVAVAVAATATAATTAAYPLRRLFLNALSFFMQQHLKSLKLRAKIFNAFESKENFVSFGYTLKKTANIFLFLKFFKFLVSFFFNLNFM